MALEDMQVWAGEDEEEEVLRWHLGCNHYPPLPAGVMALAKEAIANARGGEWEKVVEMGEVGRHRRYGTRVPTHECVRAWHLEGFVERPEGAEEESA